jgi:hypothetical protein
MEVKCGQTRYHQLLETGDLEIKSLRLLLSALIVIEYLNFAFHSQCFNFS